MACKFDDVPSPDISSSTSSNPSKRFSVAKFKMNIYEKKYFTVKSTINGLEVSVTNEAVNPPPPFSSIQFEIVLHDVMTMLNDDSHSKQLEGLGTLSHVINDPPSDIDIQNYQLMYGDIIARLTELLVIGSEDVKLGAVVVLVAAANVIYQNKWTIEMNVISKLLPMLPINNDGTRDQIFRALYFLIENDATQKWQLQDYVGIDIITKLLDRPNTNFSKILPLYILGNLVDEPNITDESKDMHKQCLISVSSLMTGSGPDQIEAICRCLCALSESALDVVSEMEEYFTVDDLKRLATHGKCERTQLFAIIIISNIGRVSARYVEMFLNIEILSKLKELLHNQDSKIVEGVCWAIGTTASSGTTETIIDNVVPSMMDINQSHNEYPFTTHEAVMDSFYCIVDCCSINQVQKLFEMNFVQFVCSMLEKPSNELILLCLRVLLLVVETLHKSASKTQSLTVIKECYGLRRLEELELDRQNETIAELATQVIKSLNRKVFIGKCNMDKHGTDKDDDESDSSDD